MIRMTRMVAAVAAALVGTSMMVPAIASADSSVASTSFVSGAAASSTQETGVIQYDAVGDIGDGMQFEGPFALSAQLLGSLSNFLPGSGGVQPPTGLDPKADIFIDRCVGGLAEGFVRYNNIDSNAAVDFSTGINGQIVNALTVPAESEVDGVEFIGAIVGSQVQVFANGEEIASVEAECFD